MASKRFGGALLTLASLIVLGCSKTADTSPERRLFGSPPSIESVTFTSDPGVANCDISEYARIKLCLADAPGDVFTLDPDFVTLRGTYTELKMKVAVKDAESTPSKSDILLVGASYKDPFNPEENTVLLFDDGKANQFPPSIKGDATNVCTVDEFGVCQCAKDTSIILDSGDTMAGDQIFERSFALYTFKGGFNATNAFQDCIQKSSHEAPLIIPTDVPLEFQIDVTDRSGNLTTWPDKPKVNTTSDTLECLGDQCFCCIFITSTSPTVDCRQLPGLLGPPGSGNEAGYCIVNIP